MGKVSRRGLFGWIGAFAAASPFMAHAPRPTRLVNLFADYTPPPRYDFGMHVRVPSNYVVAPLTNADVEFAANYDFRKIIDG